MELGQHIYLWYDLGVFNLEEVTDEKKNTHFDKEHF